MYIKDCWPIDVVLTINLLSFFETWKTVSDQFQWSFAAVCLVAWPLNESEAGGDLVLIETSLLFLCKHQLIGMRTAPLA